MKGSSWLEWLVGPLFPSRQLIAVPLLAIVQQLDAVHLPNVVQLLFPPALKLCSFS